MSKSPFSISQKSDQTKNRRPKDSVPPPSRRGRPLPQSRNTGGRPGVCKRGTHLNKS